MGAHFTSCFHIPYYFIGKWRLTKASWTGREKTWYSIALGAVNYKLALTNFIADHWTTAFAICLCGDWTLCCCSCWPSTPEGVQGGVRHSVLQEIWWDRSLDQFSSVQFSRSVLSDSLQPHESQHARPPCPSPTPRVLSNSHPSSQWCHPAISSSVVPFSSCPQSIPVSGSFPMSQLFAWGGQSTGVSASASVLPMNTQD